MTKLRKYIFIIIGVISIIFSIDCFTFSDLDFELSKSYGGDAYTGIQQACAKTSENLSSLTYRVQYGFGAILLIAGLGFLGVGLTTTKVNTQVEED